MSETAGALAWIRRTYRMPTMAFWTSFCVVMGRTTARMPNAVRYDAVSRWKLNWADGARRLVNLEPTIVRAPDLPVPDTTLPRGRLIVANHRTPLDVIALMQIFGGHFLANHKTRTAPVVGVAAEAIGTLFVDRDDRQSGALAVRAMRKLLQEKRTVVVFPEGTTYDGDEVRPFKGGAFVAASGLDVDVVPVGIAYRPGTEFVGESLGSHAKRFLSRPATRSWLAIGDPVPFPEKRRGVEDDLRERVQALVHEARRHATPILTSGEGDAEAAAERSRAAR